MLHTYNIILMIYDNMMIYFIVDDCSVKLPLKKKKKIFLTGASVLLLWDAVSQAHCLSYVNSRGHSTRDPTDLDHGPWSALPHQHSSEVKLATGTVCLHIHVSITTIIFFDTFRILKLQSKLFHTTKIMCVCKKKIYIL